ncbi:hypothetical protein [Halorientalis salina]|uniref:hypothetical protein n=1 Tax=Halorientalis salina TaxID=2932266 RepID=UPI0010ABE118|nr:hypothetical protein [Halorientalis salina]
MSTDTPDADTTDETDLTPDHTNDHAAAPTLTVIATGPAAFARQIGDDDATVVATHQDIKVTIERDITAAEDFEQVLVPTFKGRGPTICTTAIVDRLLANHAMDGYTRAGEPDSWEVTITGTTDDWKQMGLALEPEGKLHRKGDRYSTVIWNLYSLAADDVTNDGAVLAALDLIDQHEIDASRSRFTDLLLTNSDDA